MARVTFSSPYECPTCRKSCRATWEENDTSWGGNENRVLLQEPAGFYKIDKRDPMGDPMFACTECRTEAKG